MKIKLLLTLSLLTTIVKAQTSLPNGNFENWDSKSYENPKYYNSSNNDVIRQNLPFNCEKSTQAYHGTYALKLTTIGNAMDTMFGYIVNGNPDDDPNYWHGGIPYAEKPAGIRAYYKSDIPAGDTGLIIIAFSKGGVNIGTYVFNLYGQHNTYTLFSQSFSPALTQVPDSVIFAVTSSYALAESGIAGSVLYIDSVSFTGVSNQPAQLNGDFEEWETVLEEVPSKWYTRDQREYISIKTTDKHLGQFAVKLETRLGEQNGNARASAGSVSTGYYDWNCNQCQQKGGYPFINAIDTLIFWYKFTSVGNSKASVYLNVRKNGNNIWGQTLDLDATSTYKVAQIPINAGQVPDSLIVDFQSSRWQDSATSSIGSVLYIDEVQLKSQPLKTHVKSILKARGIVMYPNPANDLLHVQLKESNAKSIRIIDLQGKLLLNLPITSTDMKINLTELPEGMYLIAVEDFENHLSFEKLTIQH